jgi:hypothetical protein
MGVWGIDFISVSTILPLDFGNVPTMWYCLFYISVFSIDISDDVSRFKGAYRLVIIVVKIKKKICYSKYTIP